MTLDSFMSFQGQMVNIERNEKVISTEKALSNREKSTNRKYFGFYPNSDIHIDDYIVTDVGERFYIEDVQTQYINGKPFQIKAYYLTMGELNRTQQSQQSTVYNIDTVNNSVIGNYNSVNYQQSISELKEQASHISDDKNELNQIISILEMIVDEKLPAKKGLFSRFSDTLAKHSWLTGQMANALINWLMSQN